MNTMRGLALPELESLVLADSPLLVLPLVIPPGTLTLLEEDSFSMAMVQCPDCSKRASKSAFRFSSRAIRSFSYHIMCIVRELEMTIIPKKEGTSCIFLRIGNSME